MQKFFSKILCQCPVVYSVKPKQCGRGLRPPGSDPDKGSLAILHSPAKHQPATPSIQAESRPLLKPRMLTCKSQLKCRLTPPWSFPNSPGKSRPALTAARCIKVHPPHATCFHLWGHPLLIPWRQEPIFSLLYPASSFNSIVITT